jgi:hypothetical protein
VYRRLRGLPISAGFTSSHSLVNQPALSSRKRMGYSVPDAIPVCLERSAPAKPSSGACIRALRILSVGPVRRGESLPIVETLHRGLRFCQASDNRKGQHRKLAALASILALSTNMVA